VLGGVASAGACRRPRSLRLRCVRLPRAPGSALFPYTTLFRSGIGAPVRDHRNEVICALSISAPIWRVTREDLPRLGRHVAESANALSVSLGWRECSR